MKKELKERFLKISSDIEVTEEESLESLEKEKVRAKQEKQFPKKPAKQILICPI